MGITPNFKFEFYNNLNYTSLFVMWCYLPNI